MLSVEVMPVNERHLPAVRSLLASNGLPDDISPQKGIFVGLFAKDELLGCGGLEPYSDFMLLRSIAVKNHLRGTGQGSKIVSYLENAAQDEHARAIYLLTETARDFFLKLGYAIVDRTEVPASLMASSEFAQLCPLSATVMMKQLG